MSASMESKLKRRKLDALKRGVHRMPGGDVLPISTHIVGIGKCGIGAIAEMVRRLQPGDPRISALAVDIGDRDLAELRELAATIPAELADVSIVALEVPGHETMWRGLQRYPEFLTLEYPRYCWSAGYQPWLEPDVDVPKFASHFERAVAKAVYGLAYYDGARPMQQALRAFAASIEAAPTQAVIAIVFGLGGGTGSGIAVDLARHLSSCIFGRRLLVTGIGVAPCSADLPQHSGARLFPVINELDCLGDEAKNQGVVASCGELFRNPFTAGFVIVPQQHVQDRTNDLAQTNRRVDREIAALVTGRGGVSLWETLRLLNWVAAPSTQHSAARTPWGAKCFHMLAFADVDGPIAVDADMAQALGLLDGYVPEFIEVRLQTEADVEAGAIASQVEAAFHPDVVPQIVGGGAAGSIQFILPCLGKSDLALFYEARDAYDAESRESKILDHSLLLEQGVLLSEPSTRLEGMAGESMQEGGSWIAVPLSGLRGDAATSLNEPAQAELVQLGFAD